MEDFIEVWENNSLNSERLQIDNEISFCYKEIPWRPGSHHGGRSTRLPSSKTDRMRGSFWIMLSGNQERLIAIVGWCP
jgi:hypothetical protein